MPGTGRLAVSGDSRDNWAAPTGCADWSAHDVVRHLCDCNAIAAAAGTDDRMIDITVGYDRKITPSGCPQR